MKTLTKLALTGALIFGLNSCGNEEKETKTFTGIIQDKYLVFPYIAYEIADKKDTFLFGIDNRVFELCKDKAFFLNEGDSVKVDYLDILDDQFIFEANWDFEESSNKGKIRDEKITKLNNLFILTGYKILKKPKKLNEAEKYNLENKQIYEDFAKFLKNNPNKKECDENLYSIGKKIDFMEENGKINFLEIQIGKTTFSDDGLNGLDYIFEEKGSGLIKTNSIKYLPQDKQLELVQEYTKNLIKIMGKTKDKGNYKRIFREKPKEEPKEKPITKEYIEKVKEEIRDEFKIKKGIQDEFNKQPK